MSHVTVSPSPINDLACGPGHRAEAGDLLVSYLAQVGVEYVFGVPGGAIEPLYNALARSVRQGGPRAVVARHETGAAFMADGYARETGTLGVCCGTTGPGATNLITGVASAYHNSIPMLVISAQTALPTFGRAAAQESSCTGTDTLAMFAQCTRYNTLVSHIDQFEHKLAAAILTAWNARGPAHLSIPLDILRAPAPAPRPSFDLSALMRTASLSDAIAIEQLVNHVARSKRLVVLIGAGCGEAVGAILQFAELTDAQVVAAPHAKGLVSAYHPRFHGVFGFAGHASAYALLADASVDLILAVGTVLGEVDTAGWDVRAILNNKLIHIDDNDEHFTRSPMARLHVKGRISTVFEQMTAIWKKYTPAVSDRGTAMNAIAAMRTETAVASSASGNEAGRRHYPPPFLQPADAAKFNSNATPIKPQRLMRDLSCLFPMNTHFLADIGNSFAWAIHYLHPYDRRRSGLRPSTAGTFQTTMEFGSMGWAIGAAMGVALAAREDPVVCITGDGSLLMNGQEITVAVQEKLTVIFVVLNDRALGMVKHGQRLAGAEPIGFALPPVDFAAMARAMGARAFTIHSPDDLAGLDIQDLCRHPGPTLLDVYIDPEEVPPMGARVKALAGKKAGAGAKSGVA